MTQDNIIFETELPQHDHWNRKLLNVIMAYFGHPESYLDVGCGTGAMVKAAQRMGIDAYGIDILLNSGKWYYNHDLRLPFDHKWKYQLVTCIETMEHIDPDFAHVAIESIANHTIPGSVVIFSAAGPGQGGIQHVNCRLGSYWRDMFDGLDFGYRHDYTVKMQMAINLLVPSPSRDLWIGNLQVFDK